MKSVLQAIILFFFIIFEVHGASFLRLKRQSNQGLPQIGEQRDPLRFWQQVPQFGDQVQPQQNQPFGQQGQQGRIFGGQSVDNNNNNQNSFQNQPGQNQNQDPALVHGQFVGFGEFRPNNVNTPVQDGLTLGADGRPTRFFPTQSPPTARLPQDGLTIPGQGGLVSGRQIWSISSGSVSTTTPSTTSVRTTPSQTYLRCLASCPSTMEYNPICGSDEQNYHNMQRLYCANQCGNNVQMVRRGTCFPL